tara:strand:- start:343 stop:564 length:222 start_codon:yes stop_codon:yes gene_type:complete
MTKLKTTSDTDFDTLLREIRDYFRNQKDEDYMSFDSHYLANKENLMDPDKPAPWDHLTNDEDDEDIDIDVEDV